MDKWQAAWHKFLRVGEGQRKLKAKKEMLGEEEKLKQKCEANRELNGMEKEHNS